MKCPYCGTDDTKVIDSRPAEENNAIRRRRQCEKCNKRFTTYEKVETIPLIVIKKENIREPYDRGKIEAGILRSCHKRPVSYDQIVQAVEDVENTIFNMEKKEIPSHRKTRRTKRAAIKPQIAIIDKEYKKCKKRKEQDKLLFFLCNSLMIVI